MEPGKDPERLAVDLRFDVPHSARVYDFLLGGKTNYDADRDAARAAVEAWPGLPVGMRHNRMFMHRVVRHLVGEYGIRQFLDIGTGIPTPPNLHEVAQGIAPESRVVYVDNDPIVLVHASALMKSAPQGRTAYIEADFRAPESVLGAPRLHEVLDLTKPVAVSLIALVQFLRDEEDPYGIVRRLMRDLAPGSFLAMNVLTADTNPVQLAALEQEYTSQGIPLKARTKAEAEAFFDGLDLIEPGVTLIHHWRPDEDVLADGLRDADIAGYGGVARKRA
nr:SAM-dependent methyltransferase [Streptomyces sp. SBT349]